MSSRNVDCTLSASILKILQEKFKKSTFRPKQLEIILDILEGKDVFVLLPTGTGKSLCFQLPAIYADFGVTLVVSPLLSLIQNQLVHLKAFGIPSGSFNSTMKKEERKAMVLDLLQPRPSIRMLYVTAEMLATAEFFQIVSKMLANKTLSRLIVDEAHCISQWGTDFRPDYGKLGRYKEQFPDLQICAFTATATKGVKKDILAQLKLNDAVFHTGAFNRSNISYTVEYKKENASGFACILTAVRAQMKRGNNCGIVYCHSRNDCEDLALFMTAHSKGADALEIKAAAYHAGMKSSERERIQEQWLEGKELHVIAATISFGMGVDNPNVRFVIHHTLPKSMEGFYQESGRAGRDGKPAESILFFSSEDEGKLKFLMQKEIAEAMSTAMSSKEREALTAKTESFEAMLAYCRKTGCKREVICGFFGEKISPARDCNKGCDWCKDTEATKRKITGYFSFNLPFFSKRTFCLEDSIALPSVKSTHSGKRMPNEGESPKKSFTSASQSSFVVASSEFLFGRPSLNIATSSATAKSTASSKAFRVANPEGICAGLQAEYREKCLDRLLSCRTLEQAVQKEKEIFDASPSVIMYKSKMAKAIKEK